MLIDDHSVMREGFARIIEAEPDLEVCAQFDSAKGVLEAIYKIKPSLVIVDMCLEDTHGLELIKNIRAHHKKLPILVLSMYDESLYAERALRAGALGYVMKRASAEKVVDAIRQVLKGNIWLGEEMEKSLMTRLLRGEGSLAATDTLSDRELEVLQLIGAGHRTREIAQTLGISPKTVETYRAHIKIKLDLKDGLELTRFAVEYLSERRLNFPAVPAD